MWWLMIRMAWCCTSRKRGFCKNKHAVGFAPGLRGGCLPGGEARGGDFALNDIPHQYRGLYLGGKFSQIE